MPEIKHQFTGGKMNKDLDERLIPNGEYKDALNIQVSTSEGSDVGTVQNLLGNSILPNSGLAQGNADKCIGSIADEKNNKLYYFISSKRIIKNAVVHVSRIGEHPEQGYQVNGKYFWFYTNLMDNAISSQVWGAWNQHPHMEMSHGSIVNVEQHRGNNIVFSGDVILFDKSSPNSLNDHYDGGGVDLAHGRRVSGSAPGQWRIGDTIKVKNFKGDYILEYSVAEKTIKPVLADIFGTTLKFDQENMITGVNIIDDLLFWTDNKSEPKVINIKKSIENTGMYGHTYFGRPGEEVHIKEKHITVIKQSPKNAPKIELISERVSPDSKINTGVMRITPSPLPALDPVHPENIINNPPNTQNESSLWVGTLSRYNHLHDFSTLKIGDIFDTQIETDINGDSGFELNWTVGDEIVFKEFGGQNYDEHPRLPLKTYSIKAKITDAGKENIEYTDNGLVAPYSFSDQPTEIAVNGDFTTLNSNGVKPKHYTWTSGEISYSPVGDYIEYEASPWQKVYSYPSQPFGVGITYEGEIVLSNVTSGGVNVYMILEDPSIPGNWFTVAGGMVSTNGTHKFTLSTSGIASDNINTWGNQNPSYFEQFIIQSSGSGFHGRVESISIKRAEPSGTVGFNAAVRCQVTGIFGNPVLPADGTTFLKYAVDKFDESKKLFEFKFPRFAYRYKYYDGEYSAMSPFSSIAFLPGSFNYHPKKGYNLGMTNRLSQVNIKDFVSDVPDGVIAVELLYKDDASPSIYVIDNIKYNSALLNNGNNAWLDNEYIVTSEQVSQVLPSNQLLRPWDNVPKKALAQEITGNRIVYGNYVQGFDLGRNYIGSSYSEKYNPNFDFSILSKDNAVMGYPEKSVKSLREYQLGIVFSDKYGRQTPVVSNTSGTNNLDKISGSRINKLQVSFNDTKYPEGMSYFKFFVKEVSGEYYNLAMDRYYEAEDTQVWLSFPSSDRNKVDVDTFLILKKGVESNDLIQQDAKYKILDIKNEAPDFIKQKVTLIAEKKHVFASTDIFGGGTVNVPLSGLDNFQMNYDQFINSSGSNLHEVEDDLYVEFTNASNNVSKKYRIASITTDYPGASSGYAKYSIKLDNPLGSDVDFITDDLSGENPTKINDNTSVNIYRYTVENSSKFDGRFFIKINTDSAFTTATTAPLGTITSGKYRTILNKKLYHLSANNTALHSSALTGQTRGVYTDGVDGSDIGLMTGSNGGFGRFAPFFRNYQKAPNESLFHIFGPSPSNYTSDVPLGQYVFGKNTSINNREWIRELAWITTSPFMNDDPANDSVGTNGPLRHNSALGSPSAKSYSTFNNNFYKGADKEGWSETEREGVFNAEGEQEKGDVWFLDGGPYAYNSNNTDLDWDTNASSYSSASKDANGSGILEGEEFSIMDIGIGGIYDSNYTPAGPTASSIPSFYNIGKEGGNINYDGENTKQLVGKFYPGAKFRFREDPNNEVYTTIANVDTAQRIRWLRDNGFEINPSDVGAPQGVTQANGGQYWSYHQDSYIQWAIQLGPNFSKNWLPKFINSNGNGNVSWNPTGSPGPIAGGLKLTIDHSATTGQSSSVDQLTVVVDSLVATDVNTGAAHSITTGMILTSHSDDGTPVFYNGSAGKEQLVIYEINSIVGTTKYSLLLRGYSKILTDTTNSTLDLTAHNIFTTSPTVSQAMIFEQPKMNGYSQYSVNRLNAQDANDDGWTFADPGIIAIGYNLEFVEEIVEENILPNNPAIWETEPKESKDLDIYYEASGLNPLKTNSANKNTVIPQGSEVQHIGDGGQNFIEPGSTIHSVVLGTDLLQVRLTSPENNGSLFGSPFITAGDYLDIKRPDGHILLEILGVDPAMINADGRTSYFQVSDNLYGSKTKYILDWHNCFSFGNGVESNRIRDNFNLPFISNGVKVSTTLDEQNQQRRLSGLIYSGVYNSTSGVNNLNQFIAAEKITKDINPSYGSIQKLHSRDTDLIALCEDKCLRILANKDAVYNADGNPQLTANENVLGQTIPFSGEFGISKNPESFASESYRVYFTDKVRGAVIRLSKDGLTPISMHGMKDWFKDNLKLSNKLIGSHDDKKGEYNITLSDNLTYTNEELVYNGNFDIAPTVVASGDIYNWPQSDGDVYPHETGTQGWSWDDDAKKMSATGGTASSINMARVGQTLQKSITLGKKYKVEWTVGEPLNGSDLTGRLEVYLVDENLNRTQIGDSFGVTGKIGKNIRFVEVKEPFFVQIPSGEQGPELITNGDFAGGDTGWIPPSFNPAGYNGGWEITGGKALFDINQDPSNLGSSYYSYYPISQEGLVMEMGKKYRLKIDVDHTQNLYDTLNPVGPSGGAVQLVFSAGGSVWNSRFGIEYNGEWSFEEDFIYDGGDANVRIIPNGYNMAATGASNGDISGHWGGTIDNVSIKEVILENVSGGSWRLPSSVWFNQNVPLNNSINFYSQRKNLSLTENFEYFNGTIDDVSVVEVTNEPITVSFDEDVRGWVSFKSFIPDNGISMASDYYTIVGSKLYKHHNQNVNRNNFYATSYNSSINVMLNDAPGIVKSFNTLNYEGSQSKTKTTPNPGTDTAVFGTSDLIADPTFSNSVNATGAPYPDPLQYFAAGNWETNAIDSNPIIFGGGVATWPGGSISGGDSHTKLYQTIPIVAGRTYKVSFDINQVDVGVKVYLGSADNVGAQMISVGSGYREKLIVAGDDNYILTITSAGSSLTGNQFTTGTITNISVLEVLNVSFLGYSSDNSYYNLIEKDGWYVSGITTDKQVGSLNEFIEKEGKWFNYIKGVDSDINTTTDFAAFDIQGIGTVSSVNSNLLTFDDDINTSLQFGDIIYFQPITPRGQFSTINSNVKKYGTVSAVLEHSIQVVPTYTTSVTIPLATSNSFNVFNSGAGLPVQVGLTEAVFSSIHNGTDNDIGYGNLKQSITLVSGTTYSLSFDITDINSSGPGLGKILFDNISDYYTQGAPGSLGYLNTVGTYTFPTFTSNGTGDIWLRIRLQYTGDFVNITNISLVDVLYPSINLLQDGITINTPSSGDYILFAKNHTVNTSSLLGYYADVKFENNSTGKAELFSVGSEINESSK